MEKRVMKQLKRHAEAILEIIKDEELKERMLEIAAEQGCFENNRDFDIIKVGMSAEQRERIKSIRDIIRELERENGAAHIDKIIERCEKIGFDKDKVEAEIARLTQDAKIFEPVRYSGNYRLTKE